MRLLLGLAVLLAVPVYGASWDFVGDFTSLSSTGADCDAVFQAQSHSAKVFAVGANQLTAVVYFESPTQTGTLHKQSLLGNHGGMGDILVEKVFTVGTNRLKVVAEGLFDTDVLVLHFRATLTSANGGPALCSATADYTGFPN